MASTQHPQANKAVRSVGEVGRFGLVGILNTLVDIIIANVLIQFFGVAVVTASLISGTVAMINSFVFNQRFTFKVRKVDPLRTLYFFVITIFGLYVIRPLIIQFFVRQWHAPALLAFRISSALRLPFREAFIVNNFALGVAIVVVLGYNFIMYRRFVFKPEEAAK